MGGGGCKKDRNVRVAQVEEIHLQLFTHNFNETFGLVNKASDSCLISLKEGWSVFTVDRAGGDQETEEMMRERC